MSAIQTDAALLNEYPEALDDEDAFMNALFDETDEVTDAPKEPSKKKDEEEEVFEEKANDERTDDEPNDDEDSEETPEDEESEGDDDSETEETDDKPKARKFVEVDDDTYVKVKYNGEDVEVKVADLNRLYGQEAALTRKSQEVATAKQTYDAGMQKNTAAYEVLLNRTTERANAYRQLPWTQLMKDPNVDAGQLAALQKEAQDAFADEQFLRQEIDGFMQKVNTDAAAARKAAATECLRQLKDTASPHHIKGWSDALYNDIRGFATEAGVPAEMVNSITDPAAIKILHMAMQFKRGASKVVTKTVNKTPKKIVKNSAAAPAARGSAKTTAAAQKAAKAIKSGDMKDATDAFEALFD